MLIKRTRCLHMHGMWKFEVRVARFYAKATHYRNSITRTGVVIFDKARPIYSLTSLHGYLNARFIYLVA